jgi:xanthine dehydrogenase accessory factor
MDHKVFADMLQDLQNGNVMDLPLEAEGKQGVRRFIPKERLILLGGGHIALPLCRIGAMLDFSVTVVDDRPDFANELRFADADQVICDGFAHAIESLQIRETDFVCTITRGHKHDADCLRQLLKGEMPRYLGMIGSRRRVSGLMELLTEEGYDTNRLARVEAPIGLKINAQTTTEIAISIAAQLVEYRRKNASGQKMDIHADYMPMTNVDMALMKTLAEPKEAMMLAVVMDTKGSTPVKAGAMMAVGHLGRIEGTIGGGCGEAEIMQIARRIVGTGQKKIFSVNMTNEIAEDEGMVCGGVMDVLLEDIT